MASARILCLLFIFASLFYKTSAIDCYYCNSGNDSACVDMQKADKETRARMVVNCEATIELEKPVTFFCRKIAQTIYIPDLKKTVYRVTRGCAWVKSKEDCYYVKNLIHSDTVCQCFTANCNGSQGLEFSFVLLAAVVVMWRMA